MKLAKVVSSAGSLVVSAIKAAAVMTVCAIACAAIIYSYEVTPIFLWALAPVFALAAFTSPTLIFGAWVEDGQMAALRMTFYVLLFWTTVFVYVDLMRYLASAWQIRISAEVKAVLEFPRYFVFHAQNFFRDLWSVITGAPYEPPIEIIPEPSRPIPKDVGPWFTVKESVSDQGETILVGFITNWLFQIWWEGRKR